MIHDDVDDFFKRFIFNSALVLLLIFLLKVFAVFYATSRDVGLSFPYDSLVFMQEHRFTDWLIPIAYSKLDNPFDLSNVLYSQLPPAPYSILTFWLLRITNSLGVYQFFLILFSALVCLNYMIGKLIISENDIRFYPLAYVAILVTSYPIWLLVDRGNTELFGLLMASIFFYNVLVLKNPLVEAISVALLASLKPSWILYLLVVVFFKPKYCIAALLISFSVYAYPILFLGSDWDYLYLLVVKNLPVMVGVSTFCHNLTCGLRTFSSSNATVDYGFAILSISVLVAYVAVLKSGLIKSVDIANRSAIAFIAVTFVTLLANNPSPDYRLPILFPVYIYIILSLRGWNSIFNKLLLLSFVLVFGFVNIPIVGLFSYYTVLRFVGVIILSIFFVYMLFSKKFIREIAI